MTRVAWQPVGLAGVLLLAAGTSQAAVQGRDSVCWLGTGRWQLRQKGGEVYLVECPLPRRDWLPREKRHRWHVSAPTIKAESGKLLGYDPKGRDPSVRLVSEKGASSRWVFEVVSRLRPGPAREERGMKEGAAGFTFRVMAAEGPYRHWYLAAEAPSPRQTHRRLKLVRHRKNATVFEHVRDNYFVDHK
jgi:hypothetical protein